ncbi:MAG: hypothetical protein M0D53_07710 [Flavobacterium sp. JAD_PAG50586_2]|nr:MAG: hypothetical protein M0D53_07710 [Flavobacterium sp. JAD_PAG50586_2]
MKKVYLLLVVSLISANSFAWTGTFHTSCGITVFVRGTDGESSVIKSLQKINGIFCGTENVTITFY